MTCKKMSKTNPTWVDETDDQNLSDEEKMKYALLISSFILSITSLSWADTADLDLAGKWSFNYTHPEDQERAPEYLELTATDIKSEGGQTVYMVNGYVNNERVWGAYIEYYEGSPYIAWIFYDDDGYDYEYTMVLSSSDGHLSLGGDFENYELATMTRGYEDN